MTLHWFTLAPKTNMSSDFVCSQVSSSLLEFLINGH